MVDNARAALLCRLKTWVRDEAGNATISWVGLVAGLVALSVTVMISIGGGVEQLAQRTDTELSAREMTGTY
jgi:hypothetical protein